MYLQYIITHFMYYGISIIPHCSCYKAHTYRHRFIIPLGGFSGVPVTNLRKIKLVFAFKDIISGIVHCSNVLNRHYSYT